MTTQLHLPLPLRERSSFENFFAAGQDDLVSRIQSLTREGDDVLFLHGPAGSGRTHLLEACCRSASDFGRLVVYLPCRTGGVSPAMVRLLNPAALVCIDDVDHIAGMEDWETALMSFYERRSKGQGAMIATASSAPAGCGFQLDDLASRFSSGGVYRLKPLSGEQRRNVFRERARSRGLRLDDAVVNYIFNRFPRSNTQVFDLLDRIDQAAMSTGKRVTVPFLKEHIVDR